MFLPWIVGCVDLMPRNFPGGELLVTVSNTDTNKLSHFVPWSSTVVRHVLPENQLKPTKDLSHVDVLHHGHQ